MGKIGEWREILRSAAQRAAFWARMSWKEAREDKEGYEEAAGTGASGEGKIERESGKETKDEKKLWIEKESELSEREEKAAAMSGENYQKRDAEERERERIAVRERFEEEEEKREGYFAENLLREEYRAASAEQEKIAQRMAEGILSGERRISESGESDSRMAAGIVGTDERIAESEEKFARMPEGQVRREGSALFEGLRHEDDFVRADGAELTKIGTGEIAAEAILRGESLEAAERRGSYGGSAEMKREMLKMKMSEAKGGGEVKIEMINNNQFTSEVDMDEITDRLTERIEDMMARSADGLYL